VLAERCAHPLPVPAGRHRLADAGRPVALTDFADDDWAVPSTDGYLADACREAGFDPHVVSVTMDAPATHGLIARGLAVGWVPSLLAHAYSDIALCSIDGALPRRDVFALLPPGERHPLAEIAIQALQDTAAEHVGAAAASRDP
jgi:DNA-binding transcriptional LysR family regulator